MSKNDGPAEGWAANNIVLRGVGPPANPPVAGIVPPPDEVSGTLELSIPAALLSAIAEDTGLSPLGERIQRAETELTAKCTARNASGFWYGRPVVSASLLPETPLTKITKELMKFMGWDDSEAKIQNEVRIAEKRRVAMSKVTRGYTGWLVTNPQFREEQDALFSRWQAEIAERVHRRELLLLPEIGIRAMAEVGTIHERLDLDFLSFFVRWRLLKLAAPGLPEPQQPLLTGNFPAIILKQLMAAGGVFNIPDVYPIPSREMLREMLTDALRANAQESHHLLEWHQLVRSRNMGKSPIERFGRIRILACYWRVLHRRHAELLYRKADHLRHVFARFLRVSEPTVRADLSLITKRLGKNWLTSASIVP